MTRRVGDVVAAGSLLAVFSVTVAVGGLGVVASGGSPAPAVASSSVAVAASPIPDSVTADTDIVEPGGTVVFTGACSVADGVPIGPVEVTITHLDSGVTSHVVTATTTASWIYAWQAPIDPALVGSHRFVFWCGDPDGATEPYPDALVLTVDMVAVGAPPTLPATTTTTPTTTTPTTTTTTTTTSTLPVVAQDPPAPIPVDALPETR